jgi:hypothetical protein
MEFGNIKYVGDVSKYIEAENDPYATISLHKDIDYFQDEVAYSKFVKACEKNIRTSKDYKIFISYIKSILGINFCQVSSSIYDTDATIEMHHGPIFTLYDIVSVILNYHIKTGKKINTQRITNAVLQEHFDLRVQVVMLAVTNHEAAHNRDLFLHVNQGIGNLTEFLDLYKDCLDDIHKYKIWNYINMCKANPSFDRGYLDVDHIAKVIKL